jgi:hypothetical protein
MSIRIGVGVFSANKDVGDTRDASALAVDIFMKRRRSINISNLLVIPSEVEESLAVIHSKFEMSRLRST